MRDYREFIGEVLISEEELQTRIAKLGSEISQDYKDRGNLLLICILRGGVLFLTDLMRQISIPHAIEFMAVSSYGVGNRGDQRSCQNYPRSKRGYQGSECDSGGRYY